MNYNSNYDKVLNKEIDISVSNLKDIKEVKC